jgi:hypothetical protein
MGKKILGLLIAFSLFFATAQAQTPVVLGSDIMEGLRNTSGAGALGHTVDSLRAYMQRNLSFNNIPTWQQVTTAGATTNVQVTFQNTYIESIATSVTGTTASIDGTKSIIPFALGATSCTATITAGLQIGVPYKIVFQSSSGGDIILKTSGSETVNGQAAASSYTIFAARAGGTFILTKISSTAYIIQS